MENRVKKLSRRGGLHENLLEKALNFYIEKNQNIFEPAVEESLDSAGTVKMLSRYHTPKEMENNLLLEMNDWISRSVIQKQWFLEKAFVENLKYLDSLQFPEDPTGSGEGKALTLKRARQVFRDAWKAILKSGAALENEFARLDSDWTKHRKEHHFTELEITELERDIPGYSDYRNRFEELRKKYVENLAKHEGLIQMLNGANPADINSLESLRKFIAGEISLDQALLQGNVMKHSLLDTTERITRTKKAMANLLISRCIRKLFTRK